MIILQKDNINKFIIDNNHSVDCTGHTFSVTNEITNELITFDLVPLAITPRYIKFEIELVDKRIDEDIPNGKYFFESGMHVITYNCDFNDILFVQFDELDDFKYEKREVITTGITQTDFVYNKNDY